MSQFCLANVVTYSSTSPWESTRFREFSTLCGELAADFESACSNGFHKARWEPDSHVLLMRVEDPMFDPAGPWSLPVASAGLKMSRRLANDSAIELNADILRRGVENKWEKMTDNPPVGEIDNQTMAAFKQACLDDDLAPSTVNGYWRNLKSILRVLAPQANGNPAGLGIISRVPYVKLCKVTRKLPRRVSQDGLSLFYLSTNVAQFPKNAGAPPAEWWRLLLVAAYFTGLRKSDLFSIRLDEINLETRELQFTAQKTGKPALFPLHEVAVEHVRRLWSERTLLLPPMPTGGNYTPRWRAIVERAGVDHFTLHDVRRTGCSEADRVQPGMAAVFLQHAPMDVTDVSYLNKEEELREAIDKMRVPLAFKHGPSKVDREAIVARKRQQAMMRDSTFRPPVTPDPSEWKFRMPRYTREKFVQYHFRGEWRSIGKTQGRVLKVLALAGKPVGIQELIKVVYRPVPDISFYRLQGRVCDVISKLRQTLRDEFLLHPKWNPVPCERGDGGTWTLFLPADIGNGRGANEPANRNRQDVDRNHRLPVSPVRRCRRGDVSRPAMGRDWISAGSAGPNRSVGLVRNRLRAAEIYHHQADIRNGGRMSRQRTKRLRQQLVAADPFCTYCRHPLTFASSTIGHVIPRRAGGTGRRGNLVLACRLCQRMKGGRTPAELFRWVTRILAAQTATT